MRGPSDALFTLLLRVLYAHGYDDYLTTRGALVRLCTARKRVHQLF
jgi:hypothetical protein